MRNLTEGNWYTFATEKEFDNFLRYGKIAPRDTTDGHFARVQKGKYTGPGKYMVFTYTQRCPRNCCDDFVRELVPANDIAELVREEMRSLAQILKDSK